MWRTGFGSVFRSAGLRGLLVGLPVLVGCAGGSMPPPLAGDPSAAESGETPIHAVMSKRLLLQFASLNALLFDPHRTETELAAQRRLKLDEIRATSRGLQAAAADVRDMDGAAIAESLELDEDQLRSFRALAARLEAQADNLAQLADTGRLERELAEELFEDIYDTCDACHRIYRDQWAGR